MHDTPELLAAIVDHVELTPAQLSVLRRTSDRLAADVQRPKRLPQALRALEPCRVRKDERVVVTLQDQDFGPANEIGVFGGELWRVKAPNYAVSLGQHLFPRIRDRIEQRTGFRHQDVADLRDGLERFAREVERSQGCAAISFVGAEHLLGNTEPLRCWHCDARRDLSGRWQPLVRSALIVSGLATVGLAAVDAAVAAAGDGGPADSWHAPLRQRLPRAPLSRWWLDGVMITAAVHLSLYAGMHFVRSFRALRNSQDIERTRRHMLINMDFADGRHLVHG